MAIASELEAKDIRARGAALPSHQLLWFVLGLAASLLAVDARWDLPLAAWIAPVLLLRFSRTSCPASAIVGIIFASTLQIAAYIYEMGAPFSVTGITLCLVLGLAFAIPYVLDRLFAQRLGEVGRLFLLPVAAVMIEFGAADMLPVGASIGTRAITQSENLALMQIISVFGPYVIGFIIALAATVANHIWDNPGHQAALRYGGAFAALLLAILIFGEARLAYWDINSLGDTVKIAGIVPSMARHEPAWPVSMADYPPSAQVRSGLATSQMKTVYTENQNALLDASRAAARSGAKIILWSETAAPTLDADKSRLLENVAALAREQGVYVNAAIGVPYERNETFLFGPDGHQDWHYRKNHPVPGMEPNAPFKNDVPVINTPFGRLTNVICYDGDFPALTRVAADIMLLPGMDTPDMGYVHTMRMARLRAIENGYSLVRTDYYGVSAVFDPFGRVLAMLNTTPGGAYAMIADVPVKGVRTIYAQIGDLFPWLCVLATLSLCGFAAARAVARSTLRS
jgi:apolipoprotein N-acyltransferase